MIFWAPHTCSVETLTGKRLEVQFSQRYICATMQLSKLLCLLLIPAVVYAQGEYFCSIRASRTLAFKRNLKTGYAPSVMNFFTVQYGYLILSSHLVNMNIDGFAEYRCLLFFLVKAQWRMMTF